MLSTFALLLVAVQEPLAPTVQNLLAEYRNAARNNDAAGARTALESAWQLAEAGARNSPQRYQVIRALYALESRHARFQEAEAWLQLAINWRENANGRNDPGIANELTDLGMLCGRSGQYDRAIDVLNRVASMHAGEPLALADDYHRLGHIQMLAKRPDLAAYDFQVALKTREKVVGAEHSSLLPDIDRASGAFLTLRDYPGAEMLLRRSLAIRELASGPEDIDLIQTIDALAYSLFGQKRFDEAERYYLRMVALWESTSGPHHPMVPVAYDKLAVFYREQQKWAEAEQAARKATALRAMGLARGLQQEASIQSGRGQAAEAAATCRKALAAIRELGSDAADLRKEIEDQLKKLAPPRPKAKSR